MFRYLFGAALLASASIQSALALPAISVKGAKFFVNGQQFFLKGVAYQGTPLDPLVDTKQCQLDATLMQTIGTNSIRVYHVNPYVNHDGCMNAFSKAGIYVWLDLDTFNTTIEQTAPTWTEEQFLAFAKVMDVFEGYDNLGGFWIGNEVINTAMGSPSAPYIKAAVADMKSYMAAKKYRTIPIGYSAADIAELRPMLQNYLACGSHPDQIIDFFGLNSYEWCGYATYDTSGYSSLQQMSQSYNVPIFFSETGCNVPEPRPFTDQAAIFGPKMIGTWSGSIIYEWVEETNHYGIVKYPNGQIYSGAPTPIDPDFTNLANQWKNINPTGVSESSYTPNFAAPACPLATGGWGVNGDVPLPTLGPRVVSAAAANQVVLSSSSSVSSTRAQPVSSTAASISGTEYLSSSATAAVSTPKSSFIPQVTSSSYAISESSVVNAASPAIVFSSSSSASVSASSSTSSSAIPSSSASTSPSSLKSSQSTGTSTRSLSGSSSTSTETSTILLAATTTAAAPASSSSSSSAHSLMIQRRSFDDKNFWAFSNMMETTGWFVNIILPMVGVVGVVSFL